MTQTIIIVALLQQIEEKHQQFKQNQWGEE